MTRGLAINASITERDPATANSSSAASLTDGLLASAVPSSTQSQILSGNEVSQHFFARSRIGRRLQTGSFVPSGSERHARLFSNNLWWSAR